MTSRHGLFILFTGLLLAACSLQPAQDAPRSAAGPVTAEDDAATGLQLELVTDELGQGELSAQAAELETQARRSVLGSGAKDGPLAKLSGALALEVTKYSARSEGLSVQDVADVLVIEAVAEGDPDRLLRDLTALGLQEGEVAGALVSGRFPVAALEDTAGLASLAAMRPALAVTDVGLVTSEGDRAMRSDAAKEVQGVDGRGNKVGILSDSFARLKNDCPPDPTQGAVPAPGFPLAGVTSYEEDVESNDMPADVNILDDSAPCTSPGALIDEGRGMGQLIYDVAPGAEQAFHTAFNGQPAFAQGILDLADADSTVIVDDVIYFAEPMFQDGVIAQAVNEVAGRGVPYFSSAGNRSNRSYESAFNDSGVVDPTFGRFHDFAPSGEPDIFQDFTLEPGQSATIVLQWDEPFKSVSEESPGASNDLDILLFQKIGDEYLFLDFLSSFDRNVGADPLEFTGVSITATASSSFNLAVAFTLFEGDAPGLLKWVNFGSSIVDFDPPLTAPTSYGHNNAADGRGVGAAFWGDTPAYGTTPPVIEDFSSYGGVPILFDVAGNRLSEPEVRPQPDFTAPDGANTTFFFSDTVRDDDDGDGTFEPREPGEFPNFFGTSAAAPHAAAVAALQLNKNPDLTVEQVYDALEVSAIDMGSAGFDFITGEGLIQADDALERYPSITNPTTLTIDGKSKVRLVVDGKPGKYQWSADGLGDVPGVSLSNSGKLKIKGKDLEPGTYTFTATASSPSCNARNRGPCLVRKTFTVIVE